MIAPVFVPVAVAIGTDPVVRRWAAVMTLGQRADVRRHAMLFAAKRQSKWQEFDRRYLIADIAFAE